MKRFEGVLAGFDFTVFAVYAEGGPFVVPLGKHREDLENMLAGGCVDVRDYVEGFDQHEDDFLVRAPVATDAVHAVAEAEIEGNDSVGDSHGEESVW